MKKGNAETLNIMEETTRKVIVATDDTIRAIVEKEIQKYGLNADLNHIDVSQVTDMSNLFHYSKFNGDISQWDVSKVTNMRHMFYFSNFNGDISKWNTSNVVNMSYMFAISKFNQDISKWNTKNVEDMSFLFKSSHFNQYIGDWNTSKVKTMEGMFEGSFFDQDISKWDVRKVINMKYMFCDSKIYFDISCWKWKLNPKVNISGIFGENFLNENYFSIFCQFLKQIKKTENNVKHCFLIPSIIYLDSAINANNVEKDYLKLFSLLEKNNLLDISIYHSIDYVSKLPFLSLECFFNPKDYEKELSSVEQKVNKIKSIFRSSDKKFFKKINNNLKEFNYFHNFDGLLLAVILLKTERDEITEKVMTSLIEKIFHPNSVEHMFNGISDLLSYLQKNQNDFDLIQYAIEGVFELEMQLIKEKNKKYLNYLNQYQKMFSDFYLHYSSIQKQELLKLKNDAFEETCLSI